MQAELKIKINHFINNSRKIVTREKVKIMII